MKKLLVLIAFIAMTISVSSFAAREEVNAFILQEDRFGNELMIRKPKTDFYFDLSLQLTEDTMDIIDEAEEKGDSNNVNEVQQFINENINSEHQAFSNFRLGMKLFSWSVFGRKIDTSLRVETDFGVSASLGDPSSFNTIAGAFNNALIQFYGKWDYKYGFEFDAEINDKWSMEYYVYAFTRRDYFVQADGTEIVANKDVLNILDSGDNTEVLLANDIYFNYETGFWDLTFGVEELKLSRVADKKDSVGLNAVASNAPMLRFHASYDDSEEDVNEYYFVPFIGAGYRTYYDLGDNIYAGSEFYFGDSALSSMAMVDKTHITFNPRVRFKYFNVELTYRWPWDDEVDSFKKDSFYGINISSMFDY